MHHFLSKSIYLYMDYGHSKTKSLTLCGPNSNSNPNPDKYLECGYIGLVICRNNG